MVFRGNMTAHGLIHMDGRAAQGNFGKGIADFNEIAQGQIAAEAGRIIVDMLGFQRILGICRDKRQIR